MFPGLKHRVRTLLERPRNQILIFTWAWRLGIVMAIAGYLIMAYIYGKGRFF